MYLVVSVSPSFCRYIIQGLDSENMVFKDSCQRIMLVLVIYELFCRKLLEMYGGIDNRYFISLVGKMVMVWCVKLCIYICLVWVVLLLTRPRRGWAGDHRLLTLLIMPAVRTVTHQRAGLVLQLLQVVLAGAHLGEVVDDTKLETWGHVMKTRARVEVNGG